MFSYYPKPKGRFGRQTFLEERQMSSSYSPTRVGPSEITHSSTSKDVTGLLRQWARGDRDSQDHLFDLVYPELRKIAANRLHAEPYPSSLQTTELVGEAYLRLVDQSKVDWQCRAQFFALAATFIRRILVDRAKSRFRAKRGAGAVHVSLDDAKAFIPGQNLDLLALDQALTELARVRATTARMVELRYFGGLNIDETASVLGLGKATVVRKWRFAKAWLAEWIGARP